MTNRVALAALALTCCVVAAPDAAVAQVGASELLIRIERLENQLRQLTGQIEQMQYRNQQLEAALKRMQDDYDYRFQELGIRGGSRPAPHPSGGRATGPAAGAERPALRRIRSGGKSQRAWCTPRAWVDRRQSGSLAAQ